MLLFEIIGLASFFFVLLYGAYKLLEKIFPRDGASPVSQPSPDSDKTQETE